MPHDLTITTMTAAELNRVLAWAAEEGWNPGLADAALRPDGPLIMDLPEANTPLRRELTNAGFDIPFTTARMHRGAVPEQNPSLQAIATMELG